MFDQDTPALPTYLLTHPPTSVTCKYSMLLSTSFDGCGPPPCSKPILGLIGWVVVLQSFFSGQVSGQVSLTQPLDPSPVRADIVRPQVLRTERTFVGTVTPIRQAVIGSAVEGRVEEVFVEQGDLVRPAPVSSLDSSEPSDLGVPLIQLRTATIDIELDAARSELEFRLAVQRELQESLPSDLELAQATMGAATARHQFALAQGKRAGLAIGGGNREEGLASNAMALSRSELDQLQSTFDAADQELKAAQAGVQKLERTQQARLAQAAAQVNNQREAIRLLEDRRAKYTVRAPFEGVVSRRTAEIGQWLTTGAEVAEVVQMNPIDVVIMVPQGILTDFQYSIRGLSDETILASETQGTAAPNLPLAVMIQLEHQPQKMSGQVQALVPTADLLSRSFPVKVRLDNPRTELGHRLNPGMLVKVQITVGEVQQSLMVHKDALVLNSTEKFLMVIDRSVQPNTVKSVPVQVGTSVENYVVVTGELKADDWVVIEGNERLRSGNTVKVINADALIQTVGGPKATTKIVGAAN